MARSFLTSLLVLCASTSTWALQVTPNSKCASLCMDYPAADPSDPNISNTFGSDIVCRDDDYSTTSVGVKYQSCVNCLQNSTTTTTTESDQSWFLYNLRFALNTCLFNTANASDRVDTPCALSSVCSPLRGALVDGVSSSSISTGYAYCTSNNGVFTGQYLAACQSCLQQTTNTFYLSNFLIALNAGCIQKPANGTLLGLNSTVFTRTQVHIIDPILAAIAAAQGPHKVLTRGAIAGIAVGGVGAFLIAAAFIFVCIKKRRNSRYLKQLRSPLDPRFGAGNITAPNSGAFTSMESPPIQERSYKSEESSHPPPNVSVRVMRAPKMRNFSLRNFSLGRQHQSNQNAEWEEMQPERTPSDSHGHSPGPPMYSPPHQNRRESFPMHQAYIPPQYTPPTRNFMSPVYIPPTEPQPLFSNPAPQAVPAAHPQRYTPSPASFSTDERLTPSPPVAPRPPLSQNPSQTSPAPGPARSRSTSRTSIAPAQTHSRSSSVSRQIPPPPPRSQQQDSRGEAPDAHEMRISGPIIRVGTRFESDEDAKRARERLYREGLSGVGMQRKEGLSPIRGSPASTAMSEEMWPGTF